MMLDSAFLIDIMKLFHWMLNVENSTWKHRWTLHPLRGTSGIAQCFSPHLQGQVEFWLRHTLWKQCGSWSWMLPVKLEWMDAWMDGRQSGWIGKKSGTLTGLFILYAYTPIQDICNANSTQESQLCLLGSLLCVGVSGCTRRRYLYAVHSLVSLAYYPHSF